MKVIYCQVSHSKRQLSLFILSTLVILIFVVPPLALTIPLMQEFLDAGLTWFKPYVGVWTEIMGLTILSWLFWRILVNEIKRTAKDIKQFKGYWRGVVGEKIVAKNLENSLDDNYSVFANVNIPEIGRNEDIDFIAVGPKGVIIIEVKNWSRTALIINGEWFAHLVSRFHKPRHDPVEQIQRYTNCVTRFFDKQNLKPSIHKFLVKVGGNYKIYGSAEVYVISEDKLIAEIANLPDWPEYNPYSHEQVRHAIEAWAGPKCKS